MIFFRTIFVPCGHNVSVLVTTIVGFACLPPAVLLSSTDCVIYNLFVENSMTRELAIEGYPLWLNEKFGRKFLIYWLHRRQRDRYQQIPEVGI